MSATLADLRERGIALSVLIPHAAVLHRRVGDQLAGSYARYRTPLQGLPASGADGLTVRPASAADEPLLRDLTASAPRAPNGMPNATAPALVLGGR